MPLPEKALIARIRRQTVARRAGLAVGIGDDCAVLGLPPGHDTLVTTDFSLEGVHFRRDWHPPESVGYRCLTRGLSDIAAMGGKGVAAFLSLAVPRRLSQAWVDRFLHGLLRLAGEFGVALAGGDTSESPGGIVADIVVLGSVPKGKAILRSGARPGDRLYVTGELGGSAAAVERMRQRRNGRFTPRDFARHFFPEPRLRLGRALREKGLPSAMIDTSDGLSTDLAHLCQESRVGAELHEQWIPRAVLDRSSAVVDLRLALHGGEDYELLFTAPPARRVAARLAGVPVTLIGQITRTRKVLVVDARGQSYKLVPQGWEHFQS